MKKRTMVGEFETGATQTQVPMRAWWVERGPDAGCLEIQVGGANRTLSKIEAVEMFATLVPHLVGLDEVHGMLAIATVDAVMSTLTSRDQVPTGEMIDNLLDLRKFLSSTPIALPIQEPTPTEGDSIR